MNRPFFFISISLGRSFTHHVALMRGLNLLGPARPQPVRKSPYDGSSRKPRTPARTRLILPLGRSGGAPAVTRPTDRRSDGPVPPCLQAGRIRAGHLDREAARLPLRGEE